MFFHQVNRERQIHPNIWMSSKVVKNEIKPFSQQKEEQFLEISFIYIGK